MDKPKAKADGSTDIYFGPEKRKGADNRLHTVPRKSWFILLCLYGPDEPYFGKTWKPDDIVKVKQGGNSCMTTGPGDGWFPYLRLYAPRGAYFDRSWRLPDVERVK